ncbi:hypothetical protein ACIA8G_13505 [Lentzea sp. NPDC051213]|uniref:hypothetical protein n=1 Tax=Lentzea sp. NPDC051213 TaxID=3364126 RepID=UPI00378C925A
MRIDVQDADYAEVITRREPPSNLVEAFHVTWINRAASTFVARIRYSSVPRETWDVS